MGRLYSKLPTTSRCRPKKPLLLRWMEALVRACLLNSSTLLPLNNNRTLKLHLCKWCTPITSSMWFKESTISKCRFSSSRYSSRLWFLSTCLHRTIQWHKICNLSKWPKMLDNLNNPLCLKLTNISRIYRLKCSRLSHLPLRIRLLSLLKRYLLYQGQS